MSTVDRQHNFAMPPSGGPVRLDFRSAGLRVTAAEFDAIADYDPNYCYELIDGVVVVNPIPLESEADPNEELGMFLRVYQKHHEQGNHLDKTLTERYIHLDNSRRRADRVIWAGLGRTPNPAVDVPTIAVEFVSQSRRDHQRDYVEKRAEYLAAGVVEYWIIDRFQRRLTVCRQDEPQEQVIAEGDTYQTDLLPGFELPLADIFAVADDWNKTS